MSVPWTFVKHQVPVIAALGRTVVAAAAQKLRPQRAAPELPGPEVAVTLPPRDPALVEAFVRHVGGDPAAYAGVVPPTFFPQWGLPLLSKTLVGVPYPLLAMLNGGCRLEVRAPLPAGEPITARAQLVSIDDDGRRAVLKQSLVTGTASAPEALAIDFFPIVPLRAKGGSGGAGDGAKKEKPTVPTGWDELARWSLPARAGLDFALLTGDFNPIHWVPAAARASGFENTILHGFATMARGVEALVAQRLGGDPARLAVIDVRFVRPLVLPRSVALYVDGDALCVGDAPGGPAYMTGTFTAR